MILAVSYMSELLEREMRAQEQRVCLLHLTRLECSFVFLYGEYQSHSLLFVICTAWNKNLPFT